VRRLAKDLPTFDSIWIDALQQSRKLTAYQASCLQSGNDENLQIGPCLVREKIGEDELGESYLAVKKNNAKNGTKRSVPRQKCLLKVLDIPLSEIQQKYNQLVEYIGSLKSNPLPEISVPQAIIHRHARIYLLSRFTESISLRELLIRRGRFPADIVLEIARLIISALARLEARRTLHGNINLETAQVTPDGKIVLFDAGLKPVLQPTISFQTNSPSSPERFAGTAPELIGTGNTRTVKTDIYAIGCLCWHLLAGRPPFASGDSLTVLAKHRSSAVPDVRDRAPETPCQLAEIIAKCTAQNPHDRPDSFREIVEEIDEPRKSGSRKIHAFRNRFDKTISSDQSRHASAGWLKHAVLTLSLLLCLFAVAVLSRPDGRGKIETWWNESLSQLRTRFERLKSDENSQEQPNESRGTGESNGSPKNSSYSAIPNPDSQGVVLLADEKPYLWKNLTFDGKLVIRGASPRPAIVVVPKNSQLSARSIVVENVQFQRDNENRNKDLPNDFLTLESNTLQIRNCSFLLATSQNSARKNSQFQRHAIDWKNQGSNSRVELQNVVFGGAFSSLKIENAPQAISVTNCLKLGEGRLLTIKQPPQSGNRTTLNVVRTTLRAATNLLYCVSPQFDPGKISLLLNDCVFDLQKEKSSLIRFENLPPTEVLDWLQVTGEGTLVPENVIVGDTINPGSLSVSRLPETAILVEGILAAPFQFREKSTVTSAGSELATFQAPIRSSAKPGIDSAMLPQIRTARAIKTLAN